MFRTNSDFAQLEAVEQGQGICVVADAAVSASRGLVRLDVDGELPAAPIYLAFHRELRNVPRVRLVVDTLSAALKQGLASVN